MTAVKVCGLTRPEDVELAVALGASHLGFNCSVQSPRRVDLRRSHELRRSSGAARRVGVFVEEGAEEVRHAIENLELELLQFHRELRASDLEYGLPVVAVCRVSTAPELPPGDLLARCHAVLFDSAGAAPGGSGESFDWRALSGLALPVPTWLAGGLRADNVGDAIALLRPGLVDVASGVESGPGRKDRAKMEAFFRAVRSAPGAAP